MIHKLSHRPQTEQLSHQPDRFPHKPAEQPTAEELRQNFDRFESRHKIEAGQSARLQKIEKDDKAADRSIAQKAAEQKPPIQIGYNRPSGKTDKYGNYMIRSTEKSTIYIDPRFYGSIADDPEKIKEYSDAIGNMKMIDRMQEQKAKSQGKTIVSRGWYIDKDGGIQSWSIVKTEKKIKKTHLEGMRDLQRKITKKRIARKKAEKKAAEKRSEKKEALLRLEGRKKAAAKEKLKRKTRRGTITDPNDLEIMRRIRQKNPNAKTTVTTIGSGFSMKA